MSKRPVLTAILLARITIASSSAQLAGGRGGLPGGVPNHSGAGGCVEHPRKVVRHPNRGVAGRDIRED
jgi:hypothetical protein